VVEASAGKPGLRLRRNRRVAPLAAVAARPIDPRVSAPGPPQAGGRPSPRQSLPRASGHERVGPSDRRAWTKARPASGLLPSLRTSPFASRSVPVLSERAPSPTLRRVFFREGAL